MLCNKSSNVGGNLGGAALTSLVFVCVGQTEDDSACSLEHHVMMRRILNVMNITNIVGMAAASLPQTGFFGGTTLPLFVKIVQR